MTRRKVDGGGVKELWRANEVLPNWEIQYGFTNFSLTLNEPDESELESDVKLSTVFPRIETSSE